MTLHAILNSRTSMVVQGAGYGILLTSAQSESVRVRMFWVALPIMVVIWIAQIIAAAQQNPRLHNGNR